jgi:hypothetical protein
MTLLTYTAVSPAPPHALITHAHSKHPGLHACASLCPCTKTGRRVSMWQRSPPIAVLYSPRKVYSLVVADSRSVARWFAVGIMIWSLSL